MVEIPVRCGLLGTEQGDTVASGEKSPAQGNSSTPVGPSRGAGQARSHGRQPAGTAFAYNPQNTQVPRKYPENTELRNAALFSRRVCLFADDQR